MGWIALTRIGGGGKNGSRISRMVVSTPLISAMDSQCVVGVMEGYRFRIVRLVSEATHVLCLELCKRRT
jgi:hypothetical protein